MPISSARRAPVFALLLAVLAVSCSSGSEPTAKPGDAAADRRTQSATPTAEADTDADADAESEAPPTTEPEEAPTQPVALVRDAFATLQATLNDSCTPGNCAYFLGRVYDELEGLDAAMKADPKGPGHFPEPIDWIAELRRTLGGDRTFENLKKHQTLLIGTRDKINTWMQDHPDDYR
ncbi:hypothetical protein [Streptomyces apocyni]|uniref:hypothetical protein n=1 Tax=Streptomyces apocyni TaxID=2654677 RepID=UPI0012EAD118|nr:hypothetical protein [Streptomyces apocyni]